jgi:hypothetical protein
MEVIDGMIDNALGTMANDMQNAPSKSQLLVNMLRGQPSFADMSANPDMQPASTAPPPQMPPPRPAYNPQNPLAQATAAARAQRPQVQTPPPMQPPQMPPPQQQPAFDPLIAQGKSLDAQEKAVTEQMNKLAEPPDRTQAQAVYDKRVASGDNAMLLALAAQQAGPGFEPFQKYAMQQAAERQAPMKVAGGEFTPSGFVEDASYVADKRMAILNTQLSHIQAARNTNITEQSRQTLKREEDKIRQEMQQLTLGLQASIAQAASADRRYAADLRHEDRQDALAAKGNGPGKILPATEIGKLNDSIQKGTLLTNLAQDFKPEYAGWEGTAMNVAGKLPMVDTKAAEWWRNYNKQSKLPERHELFGGALTPGEASSWAEADISPTMAPEAIQRNLNRRAEIIQQHNNRAVQTLRDSGYNTEAYPLPEQQTGGAVGNWGSPPAAPRATDRRASPRAPGTGVPRIASDADWDRLPSGAAFVGPDGVPRRKP